MTRTTILLTLRKDLRRTWVLLAILYAVLAGWVVLAIDMWPRTALAVVIGSGWSELRVAALIQLNVIARLIALLGAGWMVLDDPPAGREPFWATRPLSRNGLLIEKLAFLAVLLWLPMLLARTIVASAIEPELAGMVRMGFAADGLLLGLAALLAGFVCGLGAWIRSVVALVAALSLGVVVYVAFLQWLPHRRLAGVLVVVLVVALGASVLWWRYLGGSASEPRVPVQIGITVDGLRPGIAVVGEVLEGRLTTPAGELSSPGEWVEFGAEHALQGALGGLDDDHARWGWSPDPVWLDEATLLWLKPIAGRPFEIDLTIEDLVLGGEALERKRGSHRDRLGDREGTPR